MNQSSFQRPNVLLSSQDVLKAIKPFTRSDWHTWIRKHHKFPLPLRASPGASSIWSAHEVSQWLEYIAAHPQEIGRKP